MLHKHENNGLSKNTDGFEDMESKLKEYFAKRADIAFAFLFGSQAKGHAGRLSDVDVAVYFYPRLRHPVEFESDFFYEGVEDIWTDLERMLRQDVDLVVLNRVPATVAAAALQGKPLIVRDWGLYFDFMIAVSDEAESFRHFIVSDFKERYANEGRSHIQTDKA